jgi:hypothetical protein
MISVTTELAISAINFIGNARCVAATRYFTITRDRLRLTKQLQPDHASSLVACTSDKGKKDYHRGSNQCGRFLGISYSSPDGGKKTDAEKFSAALAYAVAFNPAPGGGMSKRIWRSPLVQDRTRSDQCNVSSAKGKKRSVDTRFQDLCRALPGRPPLLQLNVPFRPSRHGLRGGRRENYRGSRISTVTRYCRLLTRDAKSFCMNLLL